MGFPSIFLFSCVLATVLSAGVDLFYPYGVGLDQELELGDDVSSEKLVLKMPIVFYGERKYDVWVSTNGLISFTGPLPDYKGELFPLGQEVIAPFYADVDTRTSGEVFHRESTQANELEQAALDINRLFKPDTPFEPAALLVVTWAQVGSYNQRFEEVNTFQLVIASNGYDSYTMLIYMDGKIQWVQAEVKDNIPELAAQAGFDSGQQNYPALVLPNSGFPEASNWDKESNVNVPGLWVYRIGNVRRLEEPDMSRVETEATTQAIIKKPTERDVCDITHCSPVASCSGSCCSCPAGFFGNGVSCLNDTAIEAIRFSGNIVGTMNEEDLDSTKMHVFVRVSNGQTFTAISKLPPLTGYPMQILVPLGELMGWLFAIGEGKNGFQITGGILNYSATITSGEDVVSLRVVFSGLNELNEPNIMMISINGNVPTHAFGHQTEFPDHVADYGRVKKGEYRSKATRTYRVNGKQHEFDLKETITFDECERAPQVLRVQHLSYYVVYTENELVTRYALQSETRDAPGDPCISNDCHHNADCVPDTDGFTCQCRQGYEGDGKQCSDINECVRGETTCSPNADCYNTDGGYFCQCKIGFSGDGAYCASEENRISCRDLACGENADCDYRGDEPYCYCKTGFSGDGYRCEPIVVTCRDANICALNAECVYNGESQRYECQCKEGFSGDGENCDTPIDASCARCSYNAECVYDSQRQFYMCQCLSGYTGDGWTCLLIDSAADATSSTTTQSAGDDKISPDSCYYDRELCHQYAACLEQQDGDYRCVCNEGYLGPGDRCVEADCTGHADCDENARCEYSRGQAKYTCRCNEGYEGDGFSCSSQTLKTCSEFDGCHADADCYDTDLGPKCVCRNGYNGDGTSCSPLQDNCMTRPALCDRNAVCTRTTAGDHVCICNPGFRGDGSTCVSMNANGNYLLFSQGMSVFRVPFYQAGSERGRRILYKPGQQIVGLAADCKERRFYYSDINTGSIGKASLDNTSDNEVIITGLKSPEGLAVDWVSRTLFWTDSVLDRIEVSDLEGKYRKVIIDSGLVNPRSITADPTSGKIYWSEWNREAPKIEVANMDGSDRRILVSDGLKLPNGLTFDFYRREICWADAGTRKLECVNEDGSGRRAIYELANYPFSMTTYRDNYYWTDWNIKSVQTIPRGGATLGASIQYPMGGNGKTYSIESVPSQCLPGNNKCSANDGDCKYLCLPTSRSESVCACPDGMSEEECSKVDDIDDNVDETKEEDDSSFGLFDLFG